MQDNGYKSPAYAVAELIDNAIQAGASSVELLCVEKTGLVQERQRSRIENLAILDNGSGMDAQTLRSALQFGNGRYLDYSRPCPDCGGLGNLMKIKGQIADTRELPRCCTSPS
jgi:sensor histidine kinase YesM